MTTDLADASDAALPPATAAPTSPDVVAVPVASAPVSPAVPDVDADMLRVLAGFRGMQMQHARVLHHESVERGLNATDVRFVFFLAAAEGAGATPKQAGEYLELSTGAMTSLIDRLADRGHIERRPNPNDRRSVLVHLTETGAGIATEIGGIYRDAFSEVIAPEYLAPLAQAFELLGDALRRGRAS